MSATVVAAAAAAGAATMRHPNEPHVDPNLVPASIALCTSLKKYVIAQIGARLERDAATYGAVVAATIVSAAVWDFPFLEEVDWDAERAARSRHCNTMQQQQQQEKRSSNNTTVELNNSSGGAAVARGRSAGADSLGCAANDVLLLPLPTTARKSSPTADVAKQMTPAQKRNKRAHPDPDYKPSSPPQQSTSKRRKKKVHTFEDRLEQCRAFRKDEGHLRVPLPSALIKSVPAGEEGSAADKLSFAKWAHTMRVEYCKFFNGGLDGMSRKGNACNKLEMLEEMGFVFEVGEDPSPLAVVEGGGTVSQRMASSTAENGDIGSSKTSAWRALSNSSVARSAAHPGANSWQGPLWEWRLEQCRQFKAEHGHLNMTGQWAKRMRGLHKQRLQKTLTSGEREKAKVLASLGFAFAGGFDVNLKRLEAFKAREGHCRVPIKKDGPETTLSNWVAKVRREHLLLEKGEESDYLTVHRLQKLSSLGFVFEARSKQIPWETQLEKLKAYKEAHDGRDPFINHGELGNWIQKQRNYYNNKMDGKANHHLSDEREDKLRSIGFVFQAGPRPDAKALASIRAGMKKTWDERLGEFVRWKEEHGHPYVPTVADDAHKQLGRWVAKQRMAYRAYQRQAAGVGGSDGTRKRSAYGVLTAEKALKLANAGFAFDASHVHKTPREGGPGSAQAEAEVAADYDREERSVENSHEEEERALFSELNGP